MKYSIPVISALILLVILSSCPFNGPDPSYTITMYISLGLYGDFLPDPYSIYDIIDLSEYGGKTVFFSVEGVDGGMNDAVNKQGTDVFEWTGGSSSSSTQYASYTMDLADNTMYLRGSYKFRIYIDWDDSSSLTTGDVVFASYSILADKDDNPDTGSLEVTEIEYGTAVTYNDTDHSITIEDPLSDEAGLAWVITDIHEGIFEIYQAP